MVSDYASKMLLCQKAICLCFSSAIFVLIIVFISFSHLIFLSLKNSLNSIKFNM